MSHQRVREEAEYFFYRNQSIPTKAPWEHTQTYSVNSNISTGDRKETEETNSLSVRVPVALWSLVHGEKKQKKIKNPQSKNVLSIFEEDEITDTAIKGKIQDEIVEILLDTGASMNIINGKLVDKLELKRILLDTPVILHSD